MASGRRLLVAATMWLFLSGCGGSSCGAHAAPDDPLSSDGFLGLTLRQAEALAERRDVALRVVGADGQCLDVEADLRPDRVNVHLEGGTVKNADVY